MAKDPMQSPATAADTDLNTRALMSAVNGKLSRVSIATSMACAFLAFALWSMMPLKQAVPYVVQVNSTSGEVTVPADQAVAQFNPQWASIDFFLRRWVTDMFTINQYLTVNIYDPRAQGFLRGQNAIAEYKAFRESDKTFEQLAEDPSLVRDVNILSLTPIAGTENGVVAQVTMTVHRKGQPLVVNKLVTIYYAFIKTNDIPTLRQNPISIYITDFKLSDS